MNDTPVKNKYNKKNLRRPDTSVGDRPQTINRFAFSTWGKTWGVHKYLWPRPPTSPSPSPCTKLRSCTRQVCDSGHSHVLRRRKQRQKRLVWFRSELPGVHQNHPTRHHLSGLILTGHSSRF